MTPNLLLAAPSLPSWTQRPMGIRHFSLYRHPKDSSPPRLPRLASGPSGVTILWAPCSETSPHSAQIAKALPFCPRLDYTESMSVLSGLCVVLKTEAAPRMHGQIPQPTGPSEPALLGILIHTFQRKDRTVFKSRNMATLNMFESMSYPYF